MFSTTILPNFRKLSNIVSLSNDQIVQIESAGGIIMDLEYMNEASFLRLSDGLKTLTERYGLEAHHKELLYLTLFKNEQIRERYDAYWQNYNDDLTSKEVAKFLLAYKTSNPRQDFHLTAKAFTGSATIKKSLIARWMAETIYKQIEEQNFPLDLFGEKLMHDLFGDDFMNGEPISMERLEATANSSPRKPTVRIKKLYVELCLFIQVYLINQTHLTLPTDVTLTDAQANFFFDILELMGYLDRLSIGSEPKDYIHSLFRNNLS